MNDSKPYASLSSGLLARKGGAKPAMRPQGFTNFGANIEDLGWNDMGGEVESFDHVPSSISALTPAPNGRAASEPDPVTSEEPFVVEQQRALEESFAPAEVEPVPEPVVVEQQRALEESLAPAEVEPVPEPVVVEQQRALEESFGPAEVEPEIEPVADVVAEAPVALASPKPHAAVVRLPKKLAVPAPAAAKAKAAFTLRLDPERHFRLRLACAVTGKSAQALVTGALDEFLSNLPEVEELAGRVPTGQRSR
jgi:hypothetical protein